MHKFAVWKAVTSFALGHGVHAVLPTWALYEKISHDSHECPATSLSTLWRKPAPHLQSPDTGSGVIGIAQ